MKCVILSDSHGNFFNMQKIIFKNINSTDLFIFLGDGVDDILKAKELYPQMNLIYSCGNCDNKQYNTNNGLYYHINDFHKILFCHGHQFKVKSTLSHIINNAKKNNANIILYGHTHISYTNFQDNILIMNPGSLDYNRDNTLASYGIIYLNGDTDLKYEIKRIEV